MNSVAKMMNYQNVAKTINRLLVARFYERCFLFPLYFRSKDTIKNYIMWRVVDKYVMSMPFQFVQAKRQFQDAMSGVQEYRRWFYCLESMMEPMGMTLGRLYVDANFDESTKTTVICNFERHSSSVMIGSLNKKRSLSLVPR